jgi:ABC-2 type transport system permease protein
VEFLVQGLTALFWSATTFVPLFVVYAKRDSVAGWTYGESLVVLGLFLLLKSLLEGAVNPSLMRVVEHIRKGTLDFVLLKPADAQFLVSTGKFEPSSSMGALGAFGLLGWAFVELHTLPKAAHVFAALALLGAAVLLLYSIWIVVVSAAFYVVRVDNLAYLFTSIFDVARWPSSVFRGALHIVFTFVIPLALMTTYPAEALLGRFTPEKALFAFAGTLLFAGIARLVWRGALAKYTSASS